MENGSKLNKCAGPNKRAGWKTGKNYINVQVQINVQAGKMLNLKKEMPIFIKGLNILDLRKLQFSNRLQP